MKKQLDKKIILITGAAQGLGLAMSKGCAEQGATVIMTDINEKSLTEKAGELRSEGLDCVSMVMDITDTEQVKSIFDLVVKTYGRIDGLVNNAGISSKVSFLNSTISDFDKIINLNLRSVYICSRTAAEYMVKQGGGAIVNIASVAARNGGGLMSTSLYAATKGGVISLTKGMARELAQYKVRVNAIAPGSIDTPMTLVGRDPAEYENTIKKIPLHRRGQPEDLIGPTVLLLSDSSSFMVGTTLDVNGGSYMY